MPTLERLASHGLRYNRFHTTALCSLEPGRHTVRYEFAYDGGAPGSGGISMLFVDGQKVGEVRVPRTVPFVFSADEGADVGMDGETPVTEDYAQGNNRFTGRILKVTIDVQPPAARN
jgi:arylsulfatase